MFGESRAKISMLRPSALREPGRIAGRLRVGAASGCRGIERAADVARQIRNHFPRPWRAQGPEPQGTPVQVVAFADQLGNGIGRAQVLVFQQQRMDMVDRQDQVGTAQLFLALGEALEFMAARFALEEARSHHANEKGGRVDALVDPFLPVLPVADVTRVLEDLDALTCLYDELAVQSPAKIRQATALVFIVVTCIAEETSQILNHGTPFSVFNTAYSCRTHRTPDHRGCGRADVLES